MPAIFDLPVHEQMTVQIVRDVFETMLRYNIHESSDAYCTRPNQVTASVFFAGEWKGAVLLECSQCQARLFGSRLMSIPEPAEMDGDVRDGMGELVNMIGGNLKSVLPPGVSLSMPAVLEGPEYAYKICGSNQTARFSFRGAAGTFWVTLVQVIGR